MNDQVNRAEATASTEAQNADAASVVPTPTTEDGGSGSTDCSPIILGQFAKATNTSEAKAKAFKELFGPPPDKINKEIVFYFNAGGFSTAMAETLSGLGFSVGFINQYKDGSVVFSKFK